MLRPVLFLFLTCKFYDEDPDLSMRRNIFLADLCETFDTFWLENLIALDVKSIAIPPDLPHPG